MKCGRASFDRSVPLSCWLNSQNQVVLAVKLSMFFLLLQFAESNCFLGAFLCHKIPLRESSCFPSSFLMSKMIAVLETFVFFFVCCDLSPLFLAHSRKV